MTGPSLTSLLVIMLVAACGDDAWAQSRFEEFRDKLALTRPQLKDIPNADYYSSCSGEEAFRILTLFRIAPGPGFKDQKEAVAQAARKNDELRELLTDKLLNTPVLVENSGDRFAYFWALSFLKSDWATKLAGEFLVKEEVLRTESYDSLAEAKRIHYGNYGTNRRAAAWVIGKFDYPGYPAKEHMWEYKVQDIEECRSWWIKNVVEQSQETSGSDKSTLSGDRSGELDKMSVGAGGLQSKEEPDRMIFWILVVGALVAGLVLLLIFRKRN